MNKCNLLRRNPFDNQFVPYIVVNTETSICFRVVSVKPSEMQREMVVELGERAERVREGLVNATEDNMLPLHTH